jgi:hypothetical protein
LGYPETVPLSNELLVSGEALFLGHAAALNLTISQKLYPSEMNYLLKLFEPCNFPETVPF